MPLQLTRLDPREAESFVGDDDSHTERAAREALAIRAVAGVDQFWFFGDLIADLAALAAARLRKLHWWCSV
jgi:hypothetical protein